MYRQWLKHLGGRTSLWLAQMLLILTVLLTGCGQGVLVAEPTPAATAGSEAAQSAMPTQPAVSADASKDSQAPLTSFKDVSDYIRKNGKLPPNFITKQEAEKLGWVPSKGNLDKAAPGKSIGGDRFGNREGLLPKAKNRVWYEADINYRKGTRGADRILYSNDGLIYMTTDHYKSFTDITKEGSVPNE